MPYKPKFAREFRLRVLTTWGSMVNGEVFAKLSDRDELYWVNNIFTLPGVRPPKDPNSKSKNPVYFRRITRVPHRKIQDAIKTTGEYLEKGQIEQADAELLLDLLYAELGRRVAKGVIGRGHKESEE